MKLFYNGLIIFDRFDIICISFSAGSSIALAIKRYKSYKKKKNMDPIVAELKKKSLLLTVSESGKPLKLPLIRGGDGNDVDFRVFSLLIKNKKFAILMRSIFDATRRRNKLKLLRLCFFTLNTVLTTSVGLRFAIGGSLNYTQFLLIVFPSTLAGLILGLIVTNPLTTILLPMFLMYSRGIEYIPDSSEKCRVMCQVAEEVANKEIMIKMKELNVLIRDTSIRLDKPHVRCVENKLSLVQRYKLTEIIKSQHAKNRVQYFNKFIRKLPECDVDAEKVLHEMIKKIPD
jgi:hypothetical protein